MLEMNGEKNTTNKGETGIVVDVHKYRLDKAFKHTHVRKCTQKKHGARCKTDLMIWYCIARMELHRYVEDDS